MLASHQLSTPAVSHDAQRERIRPVLLPLSCALVHAKGKGARKPMSTTLNQAIAERLAEEKSDFDRRLVAFAADMGSHESSWRNPRNFDRVVDLCLAKMDSAFAIAADEFEDWRRTALNDSQSYRLGCDFVNSVETQLWEIERAAADFCLSEKGVRDARISRKHALLMSAAVATADGSRCDQIALAG